MIAPALADSILYTFSTVDIPIPGRAGLSAIPDDINDKGELLTNIRVNNLSEALIAKPVKRGYTNFETTTFSCTGVPFADTAAFSINKTGQIVGYCVDAPSAPSKQFGFISNRTVDHILLDFPGADGTAAFGINGYGQVVGQYYNPLIPGLPGLSRFHGFIWDNGEFTTLDFPKADTYTTLWSINKHGQILGEYYTFNPATNETLEHNWFIYDNGNFTLDFPPSLEYIGGPAIFLADINDDGHIIGMRSNGGPEWDGLFLFDDGKFFDIELPPEFEYADVRGMNNKGQFVGMYVVQVGIDPYYGWPLFETHGYVATPARPEQSREVARK
jgi:hypothetical protein